MKRKFAIAAATAALITASISFSALAATTTDTDENNYSEATSAANYADDVEAWTDVKNDVVKKSDPSGEYFEIKESATDKYFKGNGFLKYDDKIYYVTPIADSDAETSNGECNTARFAEVVSGIYGGIYFDNKAVKTDANLDPAAHKVVTWNGKEYLVDKNGVVVVSGTGVPGVTTDKKVGKVTQKYLVDADGAVIKGWQKIGDEWYYAANDGEAKQDVWVTTCPGRWFFIGTNGQMLTPENQPTFVTSKAKGLDDGFENKYATITDGSDVYYVDADGAWVNGWRFIDVNPLQNKIDFQWVYFTSKGLQDGWVKDGSKWVYLDNGVAARDELVVRDASSNTYYIGKDCYVKTGLFKTEGNNGRYFYANSDGVLQYGKQTINGAQYYFNKVVDDDFNGSGITAVYGVATKGRSLDKVDGKYLVTDATGKVVANRWMSDPFGDWYYATADGTAAQNAAVPYGKTVCYVDENGVMYTGGVYLKTTNAGKITLTPVVAIPETERPYYQINSVVLDENGAQVKDGWAIAGRNTVDDSFEWVYAKDGKPYDGWLLYKGSWYYLDMGVMLTNQYIGNYFVDVNGVWVK